MKRIVNRPHVIRVARYITLPAQSQVAIPVATEASGLVFIEPKQSVLARYNVRTANGVAEVKANERFSLVVSNLSDQPRKLSKSMVIGYATRNPTGVFHIPDKESRAFESVLNLPFIRKEDDPQRVEEADAKPVTAPPPDDWLEQVDLSHVDDEDLRAEIRSMLTKHRDLWRPGHLGEITATEHWIEV